MMKLRFSCVNAEQDYVKRNPLENEAATANPYEDVDAEEEE